MYQSPEYFYDRVAEEYASRFANCNTVVIDCNDRTSDKGVFTFGLRRRLQEKGISCNVTNLNSSEEAFAKAFSASKPNVVVLNTGRSPELNQAIAKLETLWTSRPSYAISLFGYTEWLMYVKYNKDKFFKFDTYIPTTAYYNQYSAKIKDLEGRYVKAFGSQMMDYLPRFAITGYDHAMQFLRTAYRKGRAMTTTETELSPLPLKYPLFCKTFSATETLSSGFTSDIKTGALPNVFCTHFPTPLSLSLLSKALYIHSA